MKPLTKPQLDFLKRVNECTPPHEYAVRHGYDGLIAKGVTRKCADALEAIEYVVYVGHGPNEDEGHDKEWPIYAITDSGRAELHQKIMTKSQLDFLKRVNECTPPHEYAVRHGILGVTIETTSQNRLNNALRSLGYVGLVGNIEKGIRIYGITEKGSRALSDILRVP